MGSRGQPWSIRIVLERIAAAAEEGRPSLRRPRLQTPRGQLLLSSIGVCPAGFFGATVAFSSSASQPTVSARSWSEERSFSRSRLLKPGTFDLGFALDANSKKFDGVQEHEDVGTSKGYVAGEAQDDWMPLWHPELYAERRVDLILDTRVMSIDTAGRSLSSKVNRRGQAWFEWNTSSAQPEHIDHIASERPTAARSRSATCNRRFGNGSLEG